MDRPSLTPAGKTRLTLARMGITLPWWRGGEPVAPEPVAERPARPKGRLLKERLSVTAEAPAAAPMPHTPAEPVETSSAGTAIPAGSTVAPFTLMLWLSDTGWLVAAMDAGQPARALPAHASLAQDLVQALTGTAVQWVGNETMSWPPAGIKRDTPLQEARDVASACLRRWCDKHPVKDVLLLGDALPQWLDIDVAGKPLGIQYLESIGQRCLALPAWPGQHTADSKRQLWRLMAALQVQS